MPVVSDRVLAYARDSFRTFVADLLDDPSDLLHPERTIEPAAALGEWRALAGDLGFDFDDLVAITGTAFEQDRLASIETRAIVPAPR